jgi:hypothetical protein
MKIALDQLIKRQNMKYLVFLMLIILLSCSKMSLKHCYECKTVTAAAGQVRVLHPCGTSKQIEDIELKVTLT